MSTADLAVASIEPKLRVFISYSRVDGVFAEMVRDALVARGYTVRLDKQDIVPGEDWRKRLDGLILEVEAVLFVISPDSVARWDANSVCAWEIKRTVELGKRLLAVDFRRGTDMTMPRELSIPNHIDATLLGRDYLPVGEAYKAHRAEKDVDGARTDALEVERQAVARYWSERALQAPAWDGLIDHTEKALNVGTVLWERELSQWLSRAEAWRSAPEAERDGKLLPIGDLADLRAWERRRTRSAPDMPTAVAEFAEASAKKIEADDIKQRRIIGRAFVKPAEQALLDGRHEHALRLSAAGIFLAGDIDAKLLPELRLPLARAMSERRRRAILVHKNEVNSASFSKDGNKIATASWDSVPHLWDTETGLEIVHFSRPLDCKSPREKSIYLASLSPDGRHVLTVDDTVILWDAISGDALAKFVGHGAAVTGATFSPDGTQIATASKDCTARIWNIETGAFITLRGNDSEITSVAFSSDGTKIATVGDDESVIIWDAVAGLRTATLVGHNVAFSPDGSRVATVSMDGVCLSDSGTGNQSADFNVDDAWDGWPQSAIFSPDGRMMMITTAGDIVRLLDAATGQTIGELVGHHDRVLAASFSPEGARIVTASRDRTARLWDAATGNQIAVLEGHLDSVLSASFSPDGQKILTASQDNLACIWDAATGLELTVCADRDIQDGLLSPDGLVIATISGSAVRLWDSGTGREIATLLDHSKYHVKGTFSLDSNRFITRSLFSDPVLWDAKTGRRIAALDGHVDSVKNVSFSADSSLAVTASNDTYRLWECSTGKAVELPNEHQGEVRGSWFSPDGGSIVTLTEGHTGRVFETRTGKETVVRIGHSNFEPSLASTGNENLWETEAGRQTVRVAREANGTLFSPDGLRFATVLLDRSTVSISDAESGQQLNVVSRHASDIKGLSFSPDSSKFLSFAGETHISGTLGDRSSIVDPIDTTPLVWDARLGTLIAKLDGHVAEIANASFSVDSRRIVTSSADGTVRIWQAVTGRQIGLIRAGQGVEQAQFTHDGQRIMAVCPGVGVRVWDVSSTGVFAEDDRFSLVATLAFGVGKRTPSEATDLLMQSASDDLFAEGLRQLGKREDDPELQKVIERLRAPLHPNCYLSPTQMSEKFDRLGVIRSLLSSVGQEKHAQLQEAIADAFEWPDEVALGLREETLLQAVAAGRAGSAPEHLMNVPQWAPAAIEQLLAVGASRDAATNYMAAFSEAQLAALKVAVQKLNRRDNLSATPRVSINPQAAAHAPRAKRPRIGHYDQRPEIARHIAKTPVNEPIRELVSALAHDDRLKAYEDADADAAKAQRGYKRWAQIALTLMTVATIISSAMLFPLEKLIPASAAWRGLISGLQSAANAIALLVVWWLNRSGTAGTWMTRRAEAERLRGDYFRALLLAPAPAGADADQMWRAKLDLVDAAHLAYQRGYLASAERRHRKGASSRAWPRALATIATLAGIAVGAIALMAGFGASMPDWLWWVGLVLDDPTRWQLGLNTAGSALLAYASARAMVTQDERNAALFAVTRQRLDALRTPERRKAVQDAADRGDGDAVLAYVDAAQSILDADHQAWMLNRPPPDPTAPPPNKFDVRS